MAPRTWPPLWSPYPCRSGQGKWYLVPGYLTVLSLRRPDYMPHACGISYVVLGTSMYTYGQYLYYHCCSGTPREMAQKRLAKQLRNGSETVMVTAHDVLAQT
jgi:hypothetical protein